MGEEDLSEQAKVWLWHGYVLQSGARSNWQATETADTNRTQSPAHGANQAALGQASGGGEATQESSHQRSKSGKQSKEERSRMTDEQINAAIAEALANDWEVWG